VTRKNERCNTVGASFDFAQDEDNWEWHQESILTLSEVEGRTIGLQPKF